MFCTWREEKKQNMELSDKLSTRTFSWFLHLRRVTTLTFWHVDAASVDISTSFLCPTHRVYWMTGELISVQTLSNIKPNEINQNHLCNWVRSVWHQYAIYAEYFFERLTLNYEFSSSVPSARALACIDRVSWKPSRTLSFTWLLLIYLHVRLRLSMHISIDRFNL